MEYFGGRLLLGYVAVELVIPSVPLDGVELGALQVVVARKVRLGAHHHGLRHRQTHISEGIHSPCKHTTRHTSLVYRLPSHHDPYKSDT